MAALPEDSVEALQVPGPSGGGDSFLGPLEGHEKFKGPSTMIHLMVTMVQIPGDHVGDWGREGEFPAWRPLSLLGHLGDVGALESPRECLRLETCVVPGLPHGIALRQEAAEVAPGHSTL